MDGSDGNRNNDLDNSDENQESRIERGVGMVCEVLLDNMRVLLNHAPTFCFRAHLNIKKKNATVPQQQRGGIRNDTS